MNPKLARTLCEGESTYKSRGAPRRIARMASRGDRSPRLTLQAGRKAGCNVGRKLLAYGRFRPLQLVRRAGL